MGLLTEIQIKEMALVHKKIFHAVCDEPGCFKLIPAGAPYIVVKYTKRKWEGKRPKPYTWNARVPKLIRCFDCEARKHGREPWESAVKTHKNKKGKQRRLSVEEASKLKINPLIKRRAMNILKKSEEPVETDALISLLRKKKALRALKVSEFKATLRSLKKLGKVHRKKNCWFVQ